MPDELRGVPFQAERVIKSGLLTRRQLESAAWRRLFRGVHVAAAGFDPDDHRMWCAAAMLLLPAGAAISGASAAFLFGAGVLARDAPVTVTVAPPRRLRPQKRLLVTHRRLPRGDVIGAGGLRVTSVARTAFDLGRQADRPAAIVALDALLHRQPVRTDRLAAFARSRCGWPGAARFLARLAEAEPLTESPMETRLRLLITDAGLPRPVAQHEVLLAGWRALVRIDLAYPDLRIAIEYEGDHHRDPATFRNDLLRARRLEQSGWLVLRFTADDVYRRPAETVRAVAAARRARLAGPGVDQGVSAVRVSSTP